MSYLLGQTCTEWDLVNESDEGEHDLQICNILGHWVNSTLIRRTVKKVNLSISCGKAAIYVGRVHIIQITIGYENIMKYLIITLDCPISWIRFHIHTFSASVNYYIFWRTILILNFVRRTCDLLYLWRIYNVLIWWFKERNHCMVNSLSYYFSQRIQRIVTYLYELREIYS